MRKSFLLILSTALLFAGCSEYDSAKSDNVEKSDISNGTVTFKAIAPEDVTKTSLNDDWSVDWSQGDNIKYYSADAAEIRSHQVTENCHSVTFPVTLESEASWLVAICVGGTITGNASTGFALANAVPATQTGTFKDAHITVAKSTDLSTHTLSFNNVTSMIRFSLTRTDIDHILFKAMDSTKVQGNGTINIAFDETTAAASYGTEGGATIRVNTGDAGTFYISTLPCTINGFEMLCYNSSDKLIGRASSTKSLELSANTIADLGSLDGQIFAIPEAVDLGLSVEWATFNVGASEPEGCGHYYAWGEIEPKSSYSWATYKYCNGTSTTLTKYCIASQTGYWGGTGDPDGKTELDPEDDVAHVKLGEGWRMPTSDEWVELEDNCTWTCEAINDINGFVVTSNKEGYTDKSIFLPVAGVYIDAAVSGIGGFGHYWSSSIAEDWPGGSDYAWMGYFYPDMIVKIYSDRFYGQSVRPVSE